MITVVLKVPIRIELPEGGLASRVRNLPVCVSLRQDQCKLHTADCQPFDCNASLSLTYGVSTQD